MVLVVETNPSCVFLRNSWTDINPRGLYQYFFFPIINVNNHQKKKIVSGDPFEGQRSVEKRERSRLREGESIHWRIMVVYRVQLLGENNIEVKISHRLYNKTVDSNASRALGIMK